MKIEDLDENEEIIISLKIKDKEMSSLITKKKIEELTSFGIDGIRLTISNLFEKILEQL